MALSAGTRLGPYEILAPLGAGGMGEVYRARDTRLDRDVALKILPQDRTRDPDRLRRFEREARAVASLDHPHILALHDVGSQDGAPYTVTELLEGRTLRKVLARGPLPPRKVIEYGVQICQALAAAHEHGVVHRDLKPENLFVTKDGQIKVLDFGLAKLVVPADWSPTWAPDGRSVAFLRRGATSDDILLYRFEDGQIVPFLPTAATEALPEFSPDGRWLAYRSDESGRDEVYVTSFPDRQQTLTVSRRGGHAPAWSRDGRTLFYYTPRGPDGRHTMMAVSVRQDPTLSLGQPATLFKLPEGFVSLGIIRSYEPHPDGRHFVVGRWMKTEPPPPITHLELVQNWFAELERLSPTGR